MKIKSLLFTFIFALICVGLLPAQDLINAVKTGDIEEVRKFLPYKNIEEPDDFNCTAYHWTAILGYQEIANLLLQNGADPNALVIDVPSGNLSEGDIFYVGDMTGVASAPVLAEKNRNNNLVNFFLSKGNINLHLRSAVMCDNYVVTEKALQAGADPNMVVSMSGERLLVPAVKLSLQSGVDNIADTLIKYGANISQAFANSFIYGNLKEDSEIWEKLLDKGAKIDQKYSDWNYDTTLLSFAFKEDKNKLDFLVKHGADLTVKDKDGRILLHNAVELQKNVQVLIPPSDVCDKACMIKYLSIRDDKGETPCDIAKRKLNEAKREYAQQRAQNIVNLVCNTSVEDKLLKHYSK